MIYVLSGGGKLKSATIRASDWYQQTPDENEEYWYACDIACGSTKKNVVVTAANTATYDWLLANAYYEVERTSTGFTILAKEKPTIDLQIFFELKSGGAS